MIQENKQQKSWNVLPPRKYKFRAPNAHFQLETNLYIFDQQKMIGL